MTDGTGLRIEAAIGLQPAQAAGQPAQPVRRQDLAPQAIDQPVQGVAPPIGEGHEIDPVLVTRQGAVDALDAPLCIVADRHATLHRLTVTVTGFGDPHRLHAAARQRVLETHAVLSPRLDAGPCHQTGQAAARIGVLVTAKQHQLVFALGGRRVAPGRRTPPVAAIDALDAAVGIVNETVHA